MTGVTEVDGVLVLPDRLDLGTAGALRSLILDSTRNVLIDASAVKTVTTPGAQVMMAARDHQHVNDQTLRIVNPSNGFLASLAILGIPLERIQTAGDVA